MFKKLLTLGSVFAKSFNTDYVSLHTITMDLFEVNLTEIDSRAKPQLGDSSDELLSKLRYSVVVLVYLLGRDLIKYGMPALQRYLETPKKEKKEEIKLA
jgi:hypothetical protein